MYQNALAVITFFLDDTKIEKWKDRERGETEIVNKRERERGRFERKRDKLKELKAIDTERIERERKSVERK